MKRTIIGLRDKRSPHKPSSVLSGSSYTPGAVRRQSMLRTFGSLLGVWTGIVGAAPATQDVEPQVRAILNSAAAEQASSIELIVEGATQKTSVGDRVSYELRSPESGHCYFMHVDSRDRATLLKPGECKESIDSGEASARFPLDGALEADFPTGTDTVFAVVAPLPIAALDSLLARDSLPYAALSVSDALSAAEHLAASAGMDEIQIASASYTVVDEADEPITTRGIIRKVVAGMDNPNTVGEYASFDVQNVQFDFGSDELSEESRTTLDLFGEALSDDELSGARLRVAGHTDDVGDEVFNDDLSMRRAFAVREYLVTKFDFDPERLEAVGFGESAPILANDTEEGRAVNRRVEMVFEAR